MRIRCAIVMIMAGVVCGGCGGKPEQKAGSRPKSTLGTQDAHGSQPATREPAPPASMPGPSPLSAHSSASQPSTSSGWTAETRKVKVGTSKGEIEKAITYYSNSLGMKLVRINAGTFTMGSRDSAEEVVKKGTGHISTFVDEHPQHRVTIGKGFRLYMGAHEVRISDYLAFLNSNGDDSGVDFDHESCPIRRVRSRYSMKKMKGRFWGDARQPMVMVNWKGAVLFCQWLSRKEGRAYRLPTEAEWEYVCRAGTTTPFTFGETISTDQANYDGRRAYGPGRDGVYRGATLRVGRLRANAWGLYDVHGNVEEWCADWSGPWYYEKSPDTDPTGPDHAAHRILRGGSWAHVPRDCRSASRSGAKPDMAFYMVGFRVVCQLPASDE